MTTKGSRSRWIRGLVLLLLAWPVVPASIRAATTDTIVLNGMRFRPGAEAPPSFAPELAGWQGPENPYHLVRFDGPIDGERIRALESRGAVVLDTISHHALLVRAEPEQLDRLRETSGVRWVGAWAPGFKASPSLLDRARGASPTAEEPFHLLIYPHRDRTGEELLPVLREITSAGEPGSRWDPVYPGPKGAGAVRLTLTSGKEAAAILLAAARRREVFSITPWSPPSTQNSWNRTYVQGGVPPFVLGQSETVPYTGVPWTRMPPPGESPVAGDTTGVAMYPIHARGLLGEGECVIVQDSGLVPLDFFLPYNGCTTGTTCTSPQWDWKTVCHFLANTNPVCGDHEECGGYHGTHVAGIAVGDLFDNPDGGYDFGDGMAPASKLVFQDYASVSSGICSLDTAPLANLQATRLSGSSGGRAWECRVHNNSWGSTAINNAYNGTSIVMDQAMWDASTAAGLQQDWLSVVAAGNNGPLTSTLGTPATAKNVLTVGAADPGMSGGVNIQSFSSTGPTTDGTGRIKPDLVTTGCALSACGANHADDCTGMGGFNPWDGVGFKCGTSMATPTVSGAAALVRQYLREGWYPCGSAGCAAAEHTAPSAALIKAMLINGTFVPDDAHYGDGTPATATPVPNSIVGFGWVNLENSLYFADDRLQLRLLADLSSTSGAAGAGLETGETHFYDLAVTGAEPFRLSLVWTDPDGPTAGNALVNDLDLIVVAPDGTEYRGNAWDPSTLDGARRVSQANPPAWDAANNVEGVYIPDPQPGLWSVRVDGANVPGRAGICNATCSQGYALVVTGRFRDDLADFNSGYLLASEYGISDGCDGDAYLDNGERATLSVRIRNYGASTVSLPALTLPVAAGSTLPDENVTIFPGSWIGSNLAPGEETVATFTVRFLKHPDSLAGEYLKLDMNYGWDFGAGGTSEFLSIPLQASPAGTPFLQEDFESVTPPDTPGGWTAETGTYTCTPSSCDFTTFSGYGPGASPQTVTCDTDGPRDTLTTELKFGSGDCATLPPCCQADRLTSSDLFVLLNQLTQLTFRYRFDHPSGVTSLMSIDPDGASGTDFGSYRGARPGNPAGDLPWELYRADLRALQKIRGTFFNVSFGGFSAVPLGSEQGSLLDDIQIESLDFDAANSDPGPPNLVTPANLAAGVSVRPDLGWDHTAEEPGRAYDVEVCNDAACTDVVWSEIGLTGNLAAVSPMLASLQTYHWRARAEDDCGVGGWSATDQFTTAQADFDVTLSDDTVSLPPGSQTNRLVTLNWINGWNGDISLSCTGLPADVTCSFTPNPAVWPGADVEIVTLTVDVGPAAPPGSHLVTVVGNGTVDGFVQSRNEGLTVEVLTGAPGEPGELQLSIDAKGDLELSWLGTNCGATVDYALYAGDLDGLHATGIYDHETILSCSSGGAKSHSIPLNVTFADYHFNDDDQGWFPLGGGCTTNLWNRTKLCTTEGSHVLYFGDTATCTYDFAEQICGSMTSPFIDLSSTGYAVLSFDYFLHTEQLDGFDVASVEVSGGIFPLTSIADNQPSGLGGLIDDGQWHHFEARIDEFTGGLSAVQFSFDTVDGVFNNFPGFMVDNIKIKDLKDNTYFLVTANSTSFEGSYGRDSQGFERPPAVPACKIYDVSTCP